MVMRTANRTFELRPEAVNGVRVRRATDVLFRAVIDDYVFEAKTARVVIDWRFVGVKFRPVLDVALHIAKDIRCRELADHLGLYRAAALDYARHCGLASSAMPALARSNATDVRLIGLHYSLELPTIVSHQLADLVRHSPCGLVGHAKLTFQFFCSDSVAAGGHEEDCEEPRHKRGAGLVEYSASSRIKLVAAPSARIRAALNNRVETLLLAALVTRPTVRPAGLEQEIEASAVVWKLRSELR